jgi:hypothetical protein
MCVRCDQTGVYRGLNGRHIATKWAMNCDQTGGGGIATKRAGVELRPNGRGWNCDQTGNFSPDPLGTPVDMVLRCMAAELVRISGRNVVVINDSASFLFWLSVFECYQMRPKGLSSVRLIGHSRQFEALIYNEKRLALEVASH